MSSDPIRAAREVITRHSKSFALASRLLPGGVRDRAIVLYAWCRACDDAVDEAPEGTAPAALAAQREALARAYDPGASDDGEDVIAAGFRALVGQVQLPQSYPAALLDGMQMDLELDRYATREELLLYCYRVAGVVGLIMCHVLGVRGDEALVRAGHLGLGMQLTNICRDVAEDWERGRLYLPLDSLGEAAAPIAAALDAGAPLEVAHRPALAGSVRELLTLADGYYRSGRRGLADLDARCALSIRAAGEIYRAIGTRLRWRGCDVFGGRAYVGTLPKLWMAASSALAQLADAPRRLLDRRPSRLPGVVFEAADITGAAP